MKFYVVATDRQGSEMRPGGIMFLKQVIICESKGQALRVAGMLKERSARFNAVQMTTNIPVLNSRIYRPVLSEGARWLQGR